MDRVCYIIAGPNGAGKTTFAREFLEVEARGLRFINADFIAQEINPSHPEAVVIRATKAMLHQIDECIQRGDSFAFETTLSGKAAITRRIRRMRSGGYQIVIYFLVLASLELAIERVKFRVSQGGHNVPYEDIVYRFGKSWHNFQTVYKPLADVWAIYDTSGHKAVLLEASEGFHGDT